MDLSNRIVQLFIRFVEGEQTLVAAVRNEFIVNERQWFFTLPQLHQFSQSIDPQLTPLHYKKFRKLLLNSPINSQLKPFDAKILISENLGKVDKSTYLLQIGQKD